MDGPTGCGTTAAIFACAKQMDFKVWILLLIVKFKI